MITQKMLWGSHPVTLTFVPSTVVPDSHKVTSSHGFCFYDNEVVLVNLDHRGWDFPGGHIEKAETPEECFIREAMEEACISGSVKMIGYVLVDNREDPTFDRSKYPEVGCQIFYRMNVETMHDFKQDFESSERGLFSASSVALKHENWGIVYQEILSIAEMTGNK